MLRQGLLLPNPAGPRRFFRRLDATGGVDALVQELTQRLENAVWGLKGRSLDPTLGRVCSFIEPGGFIHEHRDRYIAQSGDDAHLRANIVVQIEELEPRLDKGHVQSVVTEKWQVPVQNRDAWVFFASRELHERAFQLHAADMRSLSAKKSALARVGLRIKSAPLTVLICHGKHRGQWLKGKLASLEDFISMQNEELAAQRQEIESLRNDKTGIEEHYQAQLQELKKTMVGDVQRLQDEVKRHFGQQKAENARLQQQITTLKGEKTSLQQQILGLQRRIQEIEEQVGCD
ncbi:unnamed protein product [Symbiodinium pilosum]|uniref:Uncharacterized protein n=1 Tax=Symbiodinium pilosum TaxID=2952 RepID=A0A812SHX6_SYMPI|nr:unnamed protein product [Symbiodinium pilosum]